MMKKLFLILFIFFVYSLVCFAEENSFMINSSINNPVSGKSPQKAKTLAQSKAREGRGNWDENNQLTYYTVESNGNKVFCIKSVICGINCDEYGNNCEKGICNVQNCNAQKGYTEFEVVKGRKDEVLCHNPTTHLSYSSYKENNYGYTEFYKDGIHCGEDCDIDGSNCNWGMCSVEDCHKKHGFTEFNRLYDFYVCTNPELKLSYRRTRGIQRRFFYNGVYCGKNCGPRGKKCALVEGDMGKKHIGICNIEDCPAGYKQIVTGGMCQKENGTQIKYLDENGKFQDYKSAKMLHDTKSAIYYHTVAPAALGVRFIHYFITGHDWE